MRKFTGKNAKMPKINCKLEAIQIAREKEAF